MKLKFHTVQHLSCATCGRHAILLISRWNTRCGCTVTTCWRRSCGRTAVARRHFHA